MDEAEDDDSQDSSDCDCQGKFDRYARTELQQRFLDIVRIVDFLYKLSTKIRHPSLRSRSLKAALYKEIDPDSGYELLSQYGLFDRIYVQDLFDELRKESSNLQNVDFLIERLAKP